MKINYNLKAFGISFEQSETSFVLLRADQSEVALKCKWSTTKVLRFQWNFVLINVQNVFPNYILLHRSFAVRIFTRYDSSLCKQYLNKIKSNNIRRKGELGYKYLNAPNFTKIQYFKFQFLRFKMVLTKVNRWKMSIHKKTKFL